MDKTEEFFDALTAYVIKCGCSLCQGAKDAYCTHVPGAAANVYLVKCSKCGKTWTSEHIVYDYLINNGLI